jgi:(R)-2-hydroxyacyl-CoA dehydratese activating ATPase
MKSYVMGIDFGSTTAKTVILDLKGRIVSSCVAHMGAVSGHGVKASIAGALEQAGLTQADMGRTVSTGYGRRMLDEADKNYTEITCHARGASAMVPGAKLVIDIGGQDSKVIALDGSGLVSQFAMNDRCAAGTGKFLEVLARAMEIELDAMGSVALQAQDALKISSMCATFAETEVISLLAEGKSKADVLGAVHAAIANRTVGLVGRVGKKGPIVMTGGVAKNPAAVAYIERALEMPLVMPETPQIAGALGAALIGLDEYRSEHKAELSALDDEALEQQMAVGGACAPRCNGQGVPVAEQVIAPPEPIKSRKQDLWDRIKSHL